MVNLRRESFEFCLVIVTVLIFSVLGIIFLISTFYSWYMSLNYPYWIETYAFSEYVSSLNIMAFSLTLILIITLFFCLERRVFHFKEGILITIFLLVAAFLTWIFSGISQALIFSMSIVFLFHIYLLLKMLTGRNIRSEKIYLIEKSGSVILHASYALIVMSVGGLAEHNLQIPIFWVGTSLSLAGKMLSFYGRSIVRLIERFLTISRS